MAEKAFTIQLSSKGGTLATFDRKSERGFVSSIWVT